MKKTNQSLGPDRLFFKSVLELYDLKRNLAQTAEDSQPDEIAMLSNQIQELEKDAAIYYDIMVNNASLL